MAPRTQEGNGKWEDVGSETYTRAEHADHGGRDEDFEFGANHNVNQWEGFDEESSMTWFLCLKVHSSLAAKWTTTGGK